VDAGQFARSKVYTKILQPLFQAIDLEMQEFSYCTRLALQMEKIVKKYYGASYNGPLISQIVSLYEDIFIKENAKIKNIYNESELAIIQELKQIIDAWKSLVGPLAFGAIAIMNSGALVKKWREGAAKYSNLVAKLEDVIVRLRQRGQLREDAIARLREGGQDQVDKSPFKVEVTDIHGNKLLKQEVELTEDDYSIILALKDIELSKARIAQTYSFARHSIKARADQALLNAAVNDAQTPEERERQIRLKEARRQVKIFEAAVRANPGQYLKSDIKYKTIVPFSYKKKAASTDQASRSAFYRLAEARFNRYYEVGRNYADRFNSRESNTYLLNLMKYCAVAFYQQFSQQLNGQLLRNDPEFLEKIKQYRALLKQPNSLAGLRDHSSFEKRLDEAHEAKARAGQWTTSEATAVIKECFQEDLALYAAFLKQVFSDFHEKNRSSGTVTYHAIATPEAVNAFFMMPEHVSEEIKLLQSEVDALNSQMSNMESLSQIDKQLEDLDKKIAKRRDELKKLERLRSSVFEKGDEISKFELDLWRSSEVRKSMKPRSDLECERDQELRTFIHDYENFVRYRDPEGRVPLRFYRFKCPGTILIDLSNKALIAKIEAVYGLNFEAQQAILKISLENDSLPSVAKEVTKYSEIVEKAKRELRELELVRNPVPSTIARIGELKNMIAKNNEILQSYAVKRQEILQQLAELQKFGRNEPNINLKILRSSSCSLWTRDCAFFQQVVEAKASESDHRKGILAPDRSPRADRKKGLIGALERIETPQNVSDMVDLYFEQAERRIARCTAEIRAVRTKPDEKVRRAIDYDRRNGRYLPLQQQLFEDSFENTNQDIAELERQKRELLAKKAELERVSAEQLVAQMQNRAQIEGEVDKRRQKIFSLIQANLPLGVEIDSRPFCSSSDNLEQISGSSYGKMRIALELHIDQNVSLIPISLSGSMIIEGELLIKPGAKIVPFGFEIREGLLIVKARVLSGKPTKKPSDVSIDAFTHSVPVSPKDAPPKFLQIEQTDYQKAALDQLNAGNRTLSIPAGNGEQIQCNIETVAQYYQMVQEGRTDLTPPPVVSPLGNAAEGEHEAVPEVDGQDGTGEVPLPLANPVAVIPVPVVNIGLPSTLTQMSPPL
jgi:hypothetical protein